MFQGSALTQFYLLEDVSHGASAAPGTLQCIRSLLEQHDRALDSVGQQCCCRELQQPLGWRRLGRETLHEARSLAMLQRWPRRRAGGTGQRSAEGLPRAGGMPAAVHAEEQTVKGGETWLGAFLGTGGVGG